MSGGPSQFGVFEGGEGEAGACVSSRECLEQFPFSEMMRASIAFIHEGMKCGW